MFALTRCPLYHVFNWTEPDTQIRITRMAYGYSNSYIYIYSKQRCCNRLTWGFQLLRSLTWSLDELLFIKCDHIKYCIYDYLRLACISIRLYICTTRELSYQLQPASRTAGAVKVMAANEQRVCVCVCVRRVCCQAPQTGALLFSIWWLTSSSSSTSNLPKTVKIYYVFIATVCLLCLYCRLASSCSSLSLSACWFHNTQHKFPFPSVEIYVQMLPCCLCCEGLVCDTNSLAETLDIGRRTDRDRYN